MGGTYCEKARVYHRGPCRVVRLRRAQLVPNYAYGVVPGELIMSARRHSFGFLSSLRQRKTGCRSFLSSVHSAKGDLGNFGKCRRTPKMPALSRDRDLLRQIAVVVGLP